jgi:hypothetical protein
METERDVLNDYALSLRLELMKRGVLSAFESVAAAAPMAPTAPTAPAKTAPPKVQASRAAGGAPPKKEHPTPVAHDGRRERNKPGFLPDDPLLTAAEAAAERGQALSTFWRDVAAGRVSPAYYVSPRCPRWRRSELRAGVDACRARPRGAA